MFKEIICLIFIIELSTICECFVPKFFGHDSAIIVDTDKTFAENKYNAFKIPSNTRMAPPFPIWRHYPRYHIIPPPPAGQILAINTWAKTAKTTGSVTPSTTTFSAISTTAAITTPRPTVSSTTTLLPFLREDEFPAELLDIAQNKLGLRSLDEIPSISELGQLVGTNSPEETLKYIKKLALNEQGIALMKAYIESADYTDKTSDLMIDNEDLENEQAEEEDDGDDDEDMGDIEDSAGVNDEGLVVVTDEDSTDDYEINSADELSSQIIEALPENQSLVERLANAVHMNSLLNNVEERKQNEKFNLVNKITESGKKVSNKEKSHPKDFIQNEQQNSEIENNTLKTSHTKDIIQNEQQNFEIKNNTLKAPILLRDSLPFNYPIPIRIQSSTTTTLPPTSNNTSVVYLNTPKVIIPHVHQISRVTNIPVKQIEDFVANKPKLLDLVTKVRRFPIGYDRNSPLEAQVIAAVQKAFEEDDDLKKLLSSAATLK